MFELNHSSLILQTKLTDRILTEFITLIPLPFQDPMTLTSHYDAGDEKIAVEITIRLIKDVHRTETGYLQVTSTE